jgi:hypothetical protein
MIDVGRLILPVAVSESGVGCPNTAHGNCGHVDAGATLCGGTRSSADDDPATVIRAALERWRDDFNEGRADHICDLFAHDLRYDF